MYYQELPSSGLLRKGFGISYEYGDEYIFVLGGEDLDTFEYTAKCLKFNANSLKWENMPEMEHPRYFPGSFQSMNRSKLFAFGGEHDSVEVLNIF